MKAHFILGLPAAVVIAGAVFVGATAAGASSAFTLGSAHRDDQAVVSDQDSSALESHDLTCPGGYYVAGVEAVETTWGLYPSIEQFSLTCRNIDDKTETEKVSWPDKLYVEGASFGSPDYVRDQDCADDGGFVTGLRIDDDAFIKDFQLRCGEGVVSGTGNSAKAKVDNHGFTGDWVFDRTQSDDDQDSIGCNDSHRVVTGLRIRYREDSDEIAVTRVQLSCSPLQLD